MANAIIQHSFFATAPKYLSELLAEELKTQGATIISTRLAGVAFQSDIATAYRACLWSRLANRILLPLKTFKASDPEALYEGVQSIDWSLHFSEDNTFAVDFSSNASQISHTQYGAQKAKDAIVDQFRTRTGIRPSVQLHLPQIKINIYLHRDIATVSLDLTGESLHKRGYRKNLTDAPLKENLAAAILLRAGWPEIAEKGGAFLDVMCGSGTLPIEAALIAGNIAPGLLRSHFGFLHWKQHQPLLWQQIQDEARKAQKKIISPIVGYDADTSAIKQAHSNCTEAGFEKIIHLEKRELTRLGITETLKSHPGLVVANPPYGERLGDAETLQYLYRNLGEQFKTHYNGWQAAIFTGNPALGKAMQLRAKNYYAFYNGALPCRLLLFPLLPEFYRREPETINARKIIHNDMLLTDDPVNMFVHRLQKNSRHLQKWAARENINCYRLYDADLPEYAVAIDKYENWYHVQEYAAPKTIDEKKAVDRLNAIQRVLPAVLQTTPSQIFYKSRQKQTREKQYEKLADKKKLTVIGEWQAKYLVNFSDYVDTGLFLDQRYLRKEIFRLAKSRHFLNLFSYTGTATVWAALGGAASTTSVDLSLTYLQWAKKNLALNGLNEKLSQFIQADCMQWVSEQKKRYDLIFVAPPVFSRSKRMVDNFDIVRDHASLLEKIKNILTRDGKMIFATHKKGFKLDTSLLSHFHIEDLSKKTLPLDFERSASAYHCWLLQRSD